MIETIKSYLVSLGFGVDKNSYHEATKAMDNAEKSVAKFAGSAVAKFAAAEVAVTAFVAAASFGIAKLIGDLAKADLANEKLARQMWTSKDNAAAFHNTLKAMGVELQDLYLSPELMRNFQSLREQANGMRPPKEFGDQMKMIRSIQFEFVRMKLEATYALQWIGYYLIKYMGGPLSQIKLTLKDINDTIIKTMPSWTKVVAQVMSWFAQMGITTVRAIKDIIRVFDDVGDKIPKNLKLIAEAAAAIGLIIETGPIGIIAAIIVGAILLLNDFYTALDGGDAAFGPFWKKVIAFFDKLKESGGVIDQFKNGFKVAADFVSNAVDLMKSGVIDFYTTLRDNGAIDSLKHAFSNTFDIISNIVGTVIEWIKQMFSELSKQGALTELWQNFKNIVSAVFELIDAVTGAIKKFFELDAVKETLKVIGTILTGVVVVAFKVINEVLKDITAAIGIVSKIFKGDFKGALKSFWDLVTVKDLGTPEPTTAPSYIYPQSHTYNNTNSSTSSNTNNNHSPTVTMNPTYNIYGSDPRATADATQNNMDAMYMRSMRGLVR